MASPDKPTVQVTSTERDLLPDFEWAAVGDEETPLAEVTYFLQVTTPDDEAFASPVQETGGIPNEAALGETVYYELATALEAGSYLVRVGSVDSEANTTWSDAVPFHVIFNTIDNTKIFKVSPPYEDPLLGQARFLNQATKALWNLLKSNATLLELGGI